MLRLALLFLILAVVAALFGFNVIATTASGAAQIIFVVFLVLFVIALIGSAASGRPRDLV